jgi:geranylgeranyl pyrophosphate synthase
MITALSVASGASGMVAGQTIDLDSVGKQLNVNELENMHHHKTGALISASVKLGALAAGNVSDQQFVALDEYARCIGLAFQVQDDILDIESSTEILGKKQGSDAARNKPTYPALLGMDNAKQKLNDLIEQAKNTLTIFDDATLLKALADYIRKRAY